VAALRGTARKEKNAMSKAHLPPVPPDQRSKVPGSEQAAGNTAGDLNAEQNQSADRTAYQRGKNQDLKQNTTHQGYQQDR
jgi:hypothetical protein